MGQVRLDGALTVGDKCADACGDGPVTSLPLAFAGGCCGKDFAVAVGPSRLSINTALGTYQTLPGIGSAPSVTKANTLYFRTSALLLLRLTTDDGAGGSVTSVIPANGLGFLEFDGARFLKLLEASGVGSIEYFASGPA